MIGAARFYALRMWAARYWPKIGADLPDAVPLDFCCTDVRNLTPIRMVRSLAPTRDVREVC